MCGEGGREVGRYTDEIPLWRGLNGNAVIEHACFGMLTRRREVRHRSLVVDILVLSSLPRNPALGTIRRWIPSRIRLPPIPTSQPEIQPRETGAACEYADANTDSDSDHVWDVWDVWA